MLRAINAVGMSLVAGLIAGRLLAPLPLPVVLALYAGSVALLLWLFDAGEEE